MAGLKIGEVLKWVNELPIGNSVMKLTAKKDFPFSNSAIESTNNIFKMTISEGKELLMIQAFPNTWMILLITTIIIGSSGIIRLITHGGTFGRDTQ